MFAKSKTKHNPWGDDHPEKLKENPSMSEGFKKQLKGLVSPDSVAGMIFGTPQSSETYSNPAQEKTHNLPQRQEFLVFSRKATESEKNINRETSAVLSELKKQVSRLEKSQKGLTGEIAKIKVDQIPQKQGIYYLRYFEWLIGVIRQLTMRIEDGKNWLQTFNACKKKKMGFWQKAKKHGTTFSMSHERSLATQTG